MAAPLIGPALEEARSLLHDAGVTGPRALDCLLALLFLRNAERDCPRLADPATWSQPLPTSKPGMKEAIETGRILFSRIADAPPEGCRLRVLTAIEALRHHVDTGFSSPWCTSPAGRFPLADDAVAHALVRLIREMSMPDSYQEFADAVHRHFVKDEYGTYFTPRLVIDYLVARAADGRDLGRVFDPACGAGGFLVAARYAGAESTYGTEDSPWLYHICRFSPLVREWGEKPRINRVAFLRGPPDCLIFDTILGALPFGPEIVDYYELVAPDGINGVEGRSAFPMSGCGSPSHGRSDCYHLQRIVRNLAVGGRACVALPLGETLTSLGRDEELFRRALLSAVALRELTVIPPEVYENSSTPMVALVFDKVCELGDCVEQAGLAIRAGVQPATREFRIRQMPSVAPDNEAPDSEAPDSEAPDGEAPDGEAPDGEAPDSVAPGEAPGRVVTLEELEAKHWSLDPSVYA